MKYRRFTITNYRAIKEPLSVDLHRTPLIPVIGINECGKTTILHAIVAFDFINDKSDESIGHLQDIANLYEASPGAPTVSAEIAISQKEYKRALDKIAELPEVLGDDSFRRYRRRPTYPTDSLTITRDLVSRRYQIDGHPNTLGPDNIDRIARRIISSLPYILYFDDFRDAIPHRIEIKDDPNQASEWLALLEALFQKTDKAFSVYDLPKKEERQRKTILSSVKKNLNRTLTREWNSFRLEDTDALSVDLEYESALESGLTKNYLKFDIVEKDAKGLEHFFFIRNRSKGFYWFFNFVMKLEFNSKVVSAEGIDAIYVLDEPGSYLHASAQEKLCRKLSALSANNNVIYCTHSHHLLDPLTIPFGAIRIAEKDSNGRVTLHSIHEHAGKIGERVGAFQPLYDALHVRPFAGDLDRRESIIVTEGIIDYYLLETFKGGRKFRTLPSVGADSIAYFVSLLITWDVQFVVVWDNDKKGREARGRAEEHFGEEIATQHFRLLPSRGKAKQIMQDLVDGSDLVLVRDRVGLPKNASFDKVITALFYFSQRSKIVEEVSLTTRERFQELYTHLGSAFE